MPVPCVPCSAKNEMEEAHQRSEVQWQQTLKARMPTEYLRAKQFLIRSGFDTILRWRQDDYRGGLGLVGKSDAGKSMAVACLLMELRRPFLWWSGTEARQACQDAAKADLRDRGGLRELWEHGMTTTLLVLDDLGQASFTAAWSSGLFDLLETRTNRHRATFWTSQLDPHKLCEKITAQNGGDKHQAEAICRRLTQHSFVIDAA
jgi:DNA replication protein DnaC